MNEFGPEWYERVVVQNRRDHEFDCKCCDGLEAHEIDLVRLGRGKCLKKDCGCTSYVQQEKSAFFQLLDLAEKALKQYKKRDALLVPDWDLEEWLESYRGVNWPERVGKG